MKKVLIDDGLSLLKKKKTGIGWYSLEIFDCLKACGFNVVLPQYPERMRNYREAVKRLLYLGYYSLKNVFSKKYDVIHYTNFYMPPFRHKAKVIVSIPDLSPFYSPESFGYYYFHYVKYSIRKSLEMADKIITISDSVKEEIAHHFPMYASKVEVVYCSVRNNFMSGEGTMPVKKEKYLLYVGVIERRKNLAFLCRTFLKLRASNPDMKLYLVGKPGLGFEEVEQYFGDANGIHYFNYVSDEELQNLYRNAGAFVFPSLYEGFGKPVVEAMFYNLPILASNIPTNVELNERHGKKIMLFDSRDEDMFLETMKNWLKKDDGNIEYENLLIYSIDSIKEIYRKIYTTI